MRCTRNAGRIRNAEEWYSTMNAGVMFRKRRQSWLKGKLMKCNEYVNQIPLSVIFCSIIERRLCTVSSSFYSIVQVWGRSCLFPINVSATNRQLQDTTCYPTWCRQAMQNNSLLDSVYTVNAVTVDSNLTKPTYCGILLQTLLQSKPAIFRSRFESCMYSSLLTNLKSSILHSTLTLKDHYVGALKQFAATLIKLPTK